MGLAERSVTSNASGFRLSAPPSWPLGELLGSEREELQPAAVFIHELGGVLGSRRHRRS